MNKNKPSTTTQPSPVLIVDDEIPFAQVLAEFLEELGYRPLVAYNGRQALALALEHWPVLVITDQMMPLMGGSDLIRALLQEAVTHKRAMPFVVLVSGVATNIAGVPVDVRFPKPLDLRELEQVLQNLPGIGREP